MGTSLILRRATSLEYSKWWEGWFGYRLPVFWLGGWTISPRCWMYVGLMMLSRHKYIRQTASAWDECLWGWSGYCKAKISTRRCSGESPHHSSGESAHQSVFGGISTLISVLGNLHTNQCLRRSPHQPVFWTLSTPVSVPGNLHTSQCYELISTPVLRGISIPVSCGISASVSIMDNPHTTQCSGWSPHQSVFRGIFTPVSVLGNLHTNAPGNPHTNLCYGQSPLQSVFWGISTPVFRGISTPIGIPGNLHISL